MKDKNSLEVKLEAELQKKQQVEESLNKTNSQVQVSIKLKQIFGSQVYLLMGVMSPLSDIALNYYLVSNHIFSIWMKIKVKFGRLLVYIRLGFIVL